MGCSLTGTELEKQIIEAGTLLLNPPSSTDELLKLLDKIERLLLTVEQAPSSSMQGALLPSMKALMASELLRHSDGDVRVSVASCMNELMRITAPEAPYRDEIMKEIFRLTVAAFEKLSHVSSHSSCYTKAVSILDTVAKVRSSVVMLDLECDELIAEMFQLFFSIVRCNHPHAVVSNMETIMTTVLDESEDISWDLLSPLLASVKRENQDVYPNSWKLGEKVITKSAGKLKPYLLEAVQSMGIALDKYAPVVASICKNGFDTPRLEHDNASEWNVPDEQRASNKVGLVEPAEEVTRRLPSMAARPGEVCQVVDVVSKRLLRNDDDAYSKALQHWALAENSKNTNVRVNAEPGRLDSMKEDSSTIQAETVLNKRGRKPNSLINPEEGYDPSWIYSSRETPKKHLGVSGDKRSDGVHTGNPIFNKVAQSKNGQMNEPPGFPSKINESKAACSPFSNDRGHPKRGQPKKKGMLVNQDAHTRPMSMSKGVTLMVQVEEKAPQSDIELRKEPKDRRILKMKQKRSTRVAVATEIKETTQASGPLILEEGDEVLSDFEGKQILQSANEAGQKDVNDRSFVQMHSKKRSLVHAIPAKGSTESTIDKYITKSRGKEGKETPKTKPKRKRSAEKGEVSETPDRGEELVGKRIKVWWPMDKMFYEGVVGSYDNIKRKHKVLYADGDEEILNLKRQQWKLIDDDASSNIWKEKKAKTKTVSTNQGKADSYTKKRKSNSTSVLKIAGKSGAISADSIKLENQVIADESIEDPKTLSTNQGKADSCSKKRKSGSASVSKIAAKSGAISADGIKLENQVIADESIADASRIDCMKDDGENLGEKLETETTDMDSHSIQTTPKVPTPSKDECL